MHKDIQTVDTNIILRLMLGDVPAQQKRARKLVLNGSVYFVPTLAVTEAVFVMERKEKIAREKIAEAISALLRSSCFVYDSALIDEALAYYATHRALSFNDCVLSFEAAKLQREPLWTFDKALAKQSPVAKEVTV